MCMGEWCTLDVGGTEKKSDSEALHEDDKLLPKPLAVILTE